MPKIKDLFSSIFNKSKEKEIENINKNESESHLTWNIPSSSLNNDIKVIEKKKAFTTNSKYKRKILLTSFVTLFVVGSGLTIGIIKSSHDSKYNVELEVSNNSEYRRIYLISEDNYVIPLTLSFENKLSLQEEILDVFESLKVSKNYTNYGLRSYIPKDVTVLKMSLVNQNLSLDLSSNFLNIDDGSEKQIFESLTYTFLDFNEIDKLTLSVNGEQINKLSNETIVPTELTISNLGINEQYTSALDVLSKDRLTLYYSKNIKNKDYLVPCTVYVDESPHLINSFYKTLMSKQTLVSGLNYINTYDMIDLTTTPLITDDTVVISLQQNALLEEGLVNEEIYELLILSFDINNIDLNINFQLNGESMRVNGYFEEDSRQINNIVYNSIQI